MGKNRRKNETPEEARKRRNRMVKSFEVSIDDYKRLEAIARREERTTAGQIRLVLRRFLEEN